MRLRTGWALGGAAFLWATSAGAAQDTPEAALADLGAVLGRMEINLSVQEAHEMNASQIATRLEGIYEQVAELEARAAAHSARCPSVSDDDALIASCNGEASQHNQRASEVEAEQNAQLVLARDLEARETVRASEAAVILNDLELTMMRSLEACSLLSVSEQDVRCRPPVAAGPRTADLVGVISSALSEVRAITLTDELEALDAAQKNCLDLSGERLAECARQPFDGSVYDPGRPDATGPGLVISPNR